MPALTCRCFTGDRYPDGDLADFFTPDDEERFICALCHRPLHHATLVRLRRHDNALQRASSLPNLPLAEEVRLGRDWCRACNRAHRWVR